MKSSGANRRSPLAAALILGIAVLSAGCATAGSSSTPPPAAKGSNGPAATSSRIPLATGSPGSGGKALAADLPSLITCMNAHGMALSSSSTGKQVRQAFGALPLASQERVFSACEHLLPVSARQTIARDLAKEKEMGKLWSMPSPAGRRQ